MLPTERCIHAYADEDACLCVDLQVGSEWRAEQIRVNKIHLDDSTWTWMKPLAL